MKLSVIIDKAKRKIWQKTVTKLYSKKIHYYLYKSYWNHFFNKKSNTHLDNLYFTAIPNKGAGIGHQMANWIAGYWFAKQFNLRFAHTSFSSEKWEKLLGLGEDEISVAALVKQGFKKVSIPLFDETNQEEIDLIKKIINSYQDKKVVFVAEQDQFYADQFGVIDDLKRKFYGASDRKNDKLIYSPEHFNIAIHVRRGDISVGQLNKNPNLLLRWQDNDYFKNVLFRVLESINTTKPVSIYLFSQGNKKDFVDFEQFENLHFCLDMDAQESFLHMVYADLLITSKSSFSYKPALLSNGIKVVSGDFWHGYPEQENWILAEDDGKLKNQNEKSR